MNWNGIWHLGSRYLRRKRGKTILLVAAFSLVWLLPGVVAVVVSQAESHLRHRADSTPLLVGRAGSPLELVFNGLYFFKPEVGVFPRSEIGGLGRGVDVIPLYARFSAQDHRIVGTSVDYFRFRQLRFSQGRPFVRLGECVVGAEVARIHGLAEGDSVISSPGSIFDPAGVYPLKMRVCGVMAPSGAADDRAVFVDLKTAWVIEGIGHGHEDAEKIDESGRLASGPGEIRINASVEHYNEVTPENVDSFHFHGDPGEFPLSAAIIIPRTAKAQALLKGRFQDRTDMQIASPAEEMDELFATVFRIQNVVVGILVLIGLATLAIGALVFLLSHRLRIPEFRSLSHMGADPAVLRGLIGFEAFFVLAASLLVAGAVLLVVYWLTPWVIPQVLG